MAGDIGMYRILFSITLARSYLARTVRISAMLRLYCTREEDHFPPRFPRYNLGELGIQIPGGIT